MLPDPETIERIGTLALAAAGIACMLRAAFILAFRVPALTATAGSARRETPP